MLRKNRVLRIVIILSCILAFPVGSEAGDRGGFFQGEYFGYSIEGQHATHHDYFGSHPNRYGRRYLRHHYYAYPYEEKSPYQDLVIRPAGELHIVVKTPHAKVFVDGYEVEKEDDLSYTLGLLTGTHSVKVIAEGYKPYVEEVQIEKGKKKVLTVTLTK